MEFPARVQKALEVLDPKDIARKFEVATSTVSRWARGASTPHPRMQELIVREITEMEESLK